MDTLRITRLFIEAELSHHNEYLSFGLISQQEDPDGVITPVRVTPREAY